MTIKTRKRRQRNPKRYEKLEDRQLLAGDVSVFQHQSTLYIRGDSAANQLEVVADENGDVRVQGLDGTTINRGNDGFVVDTQGGRIGGLNVNMGRGSDSLFVEDLNVQGRVVVYGGAGDDSIGFYQTQVADDLFAQTASGDDSISIDDVVIGDQLILFTVGGSDTVGVDETTVEGRTIIATGGGNDDLALTNSRHKKSAYLFTQGGNDFVGTDGLSVDGFTAVMTGFGSDDVFVRDSAFNGRTYANGGIESDRLEVNGDTTFATTPAVRSFEGDDVAGGILQTNKVFDDLIVDGSRLGTITELAVLTPQLSTLVGALQATGLDSPLAGDGPFTVFAPLNSAFDKISGVVSSLSVEQLSDVLKFHVVSGSVSAAELVTMNSVTTLLGQSFMVDISSGDVILNGNATLAATDIRAKNGVIHLLNDVLVPTL